MRELEKRIQQDGVLYPGNVVKVDTFLNHQIDVSLMQNMAREFANHFKEKPITKVFTIEASGISLATLTAAELNVPCVFAKKAKSINLGDDVYSTDIVSYTHKNTYEVIVAKYVLHPEDQILIIDDFLANGCALNGLIELVEAAGAHIQGIGVAIEKGFQPGGASLRARGYDLLSLAIIDEVDEQTNAITFRAQD